MNLSDVQVFCKVAVTSNFTIAARQLGMTRSAVSRSISRLESSLGVTLVHRTTRSISLTEAGRTFHRHCAKIENSLTDAVASVSGADQLPVGNVTCTLPTCIGASLMPALLQKFGPKYPDLTLNMQFSEARLDLIADGIDLAIRIAPRLSDSRLVSRKLCETRQILVASPAYVERNGAPESLEDLRQHRCLTLGDSVSRRTTWRLWSDGAPVDVPIEANFTANSSLSVILAACMDMGIANVPELSAASELAMGHLVKVLPDFCIPKMFNVYAITPVRRPPAKVRAVIDFVQAELPKIAEVDRWAPLESRPAVGIRRAGT